MLFDSTLHFAGWAIRYKIVECAGRGDNSSSATASAASAKDIVFVHGTPWSSIVFDGIVNALSAVAAPGTRILLYDLPGYGQSQAYDSSAADAEQDFRDFPGNTSIAFQAKALVALLEATGFTGSTSRPPPAIIAHDIAGSIVLRSHLLHSLDYSSMLLLDTNIVLPWGDGFYKLARSKPQVFLDMPGSIHEAVVRAVVRSACHHPLSKEWEDALTAPWLGAEGKRSFVRQIAQANDEDVKEMLDAEMYGKVRCDVEVMWGAEDGWIPRGKMEELVRRMGQRVKAFVAVEEAGHLLMLDQPERVAVEVVEWLGRR